MKNINDIKNYRAKYKKYYGIEFGSDYAIHHIDFDRSNNDIKNLLLLPSELHQRYHNCISSLCGADWKSGKLILYTELSECGLTPYGSEDKIHELATTFKECRKWLDYKNSLDMKKQFGRI